MAQPWKHPTTGAYYIRREIPEKLRPAFDGKALWKKSLLTKDFAKAAILFTGANADLEKQFDEARSRLAATGDPRPSQRDHAVELVQGYFEGPPLTEGGLDGIERLLLARLELDRGLWNTTTNGCSGIVPSDAAEWSSLAGNAAMFREHAGTRRHLQGQAPGTIWGLPTSRFVPARVPRK